MEGNRVDYDNKSFIEVVKISTGEVVQQLNVSGWREDKIERRELTVLSRINTDGYFTRVRHEDGKGIMEGA